MYSGAGREHDPRAKPNNLDSEPVQEERAHRQLKQTAAGFSGAAFASMALSVQSKNGDGGVL